LEEAFRDIESLLRRMLIVAIGDRVLEHRLAAEAREADAIKERIDVMFQDRFPGIEDPAVFIEEMLRS
jgi:hypothetical protein